MKTGTWERNSNTTVREKGMDPVVLIWVFLMLSSGVEVRFEAKPSTIEKN